MRAGKVVTSKKILFDFITSYIAKGVKVCRVIKKINVLFQIRKILKRKPKVFF